MTSKKRWLIGGVAIAFFGAALAAVPWISGKIIEQRVDQALSDATAQLRTLGTLATLDYQRGWRRSNATYRLTLNDRAKTTLDIEQVITHGPVFAGAMGRLGLAAIDTNVLWPTAFASAARRLGADRAAVNAFTYVGFDGGSRTELSSRSFSGEVAGEAGVSMTWGGAAGEITTSAAGASTVTIDAPKLTLRSPLLELDASALRTTGQFAPSSVPGLSNGVLQFSVAALLGGLGESKAAARGIDVTVRQDETDQSFSGGTLIKIASLAPDEAAITRMAAAPAAVPGGAAPDAIKNVVFDLVVAGLDKKVVARYRSAFAEIESPKVTPEFAAVNAMELATHFARELLAGGPRLQLKQWSADTPDGRVALALDVEYTARNRPPEAIGELLQHLKVTAAGEAPTKLVRRQLEARAARAALLLAAGAVKRIPEPEKLESSDEAADVPNAPPTDSAAATPTETAIARLDALLATGMLVEAGASLRFRFELGEGKARLNGKELPLPF